MKKLARTAHTIVSNGRLRIGASSCAGRKTDPKGDRVDPFVDTNHRSPDGSLKIQDKTTKKSAKDTVKEKLQCASPGRWKTPETTSLEDQVAQSVEKTTKIVVEN